METDAGAPEDWKAHVPVTLDSSTRKAYRKPVELVTELQVGTTRYASNKDKQQTATGTGSDFSSVG